MTQPPQLPAYGSYGPAAPPPPYEPPSRPFVPGTNGFAIAALVLGICGGIVLAIIFGIIALVQLRSRTQKGKGLAIGGLCAAGAWVVMFAAVIVLVVLNASSAERNDAGEIVTAGSIGLNQLRAGDCVNGIDEGASAINLTAVPCAEPHDGEVFAVFELPSGSYPGDDVVEQRAEQGCVDRLSEYAPAAAAGDEFDVFYYPRRVGTGAETGAWSASPRSRRRPPAPSATDDRGRRSVGRSV